MGHTQSQQFTSTVSSTTMVCTLTADIPVGHTICGFLGTDSGGTLPAITGVSDSAGNTWTIPGAGDGAEPQVNAGTTAAAQAFSARVTQPLSAGQTVTITLSQARGRKAVSLEVFDDILTGVRFDQKATNAPGSSASLSTGTSPATTQDLELVIGGFVFGGGRTVDTIGAGYSSSAKVETVAGSSDRALQVIWKYVAVAGTQSGSIVISSASTYAAILATYKQVGGSGARLTYGGTAAEFTIGSAVVTDDDDVARNAAVLAAGISLEVWDSSTGGLQTTDVLDADGNTLADGLVVSDADGRIPMFQGPGNWTGDLWLADPLSGDRYRVVPGDLSGRVATLEDELAAGGAIARTDAENTFTVGQLIATLKTFVGLTITRDEEVISTDSDLVQVVFLGLRSIWFNEWGALRISIPATHNGEAAIKLQPTVDPDDYMLAVGTQADINDLQYWLRGDGRAKLGVIDSPTVNRSAWTAVDVDSPTVGGRYVTHPPGGATDQDGLQIRLIDGGEAAELCGRVDVTGNPAAGDVIASALPILGTFSGASNVNTKPTRNRIVPVTLGTGALSTVQINADGTVKANAALTAPGSITFDSAAFRRT